MDLTLAPYLFALFLSVTVCWFLGFYAWRRRQVNAATQLAAILFAAGFWAFCYGVELFAPTLEAKLIWFNIKQLGASLLGPFVLLFALSFTRQKVTNQRFLISVLLLEPIATQIIFWTNGSHGFAGTPVFYTQNVPFPLLAFEFGPWFWLSIFIGYFLFTLAIFILLVRLPGANSLYRHQLLLLLAGHLLPWVAGTLGLFEFNNWHLFDITTFFFPISGALVGLGLFRYRLLQLSPMTYSAVFSSIRDGILLVDESNRIIEMNPAACHLLGLRERELIGQNIFDILPIQDALAPNKDWLAESLNLEFYYEKEGQYRYLELHGTNIVSNIYVSSGRVLIIYDVTERKLADLARQVSEDQYRTIFEANSAPTVMLNGDMTITLANTPFAALSGYARTAIEGKLSWTRFVHEDDLGTVRDHHQQPDSNVSGVPNKYEFRFLDRNAEQRDLLATFAQVPDSSISIVSLLDITERKQAEQHLQQRATDLEAAVRSEQERSAIVLESVSDAIALSDLNYRMVYVNPAFTQLTGYSSDELLGKPALFVVNGRLPQLIWRQFTNALIDETIWEGEIQFKRQNGTVYDAAVLVAPVYDGSKKLIGYVSSHRNITKAKQLEQSRRQFVTSISHELRTPVTNIKLYADLLHRHFDSSRRDQYFAVLNEQIERLEQIIKNTLEIAGLDDNKKGLQRELIHWESLCNNLQVRLHTQATERKILLKFAPSMLHLPSFLGDPQRLAQALYELIHNALTFTQPGGLVEVHGAVAKTDDLKWLKMSVCDDGPGIDTQEQKQVFDRFFRGKRAASGNIPGTGLGLSMVKLIAEAHDGRITLESTPGQGSTFTLWLPLT
ncbi:PAS domain S-box protein [Candidatus Leptofilum sp.]|uniref:PAS domain S-box protein n=1 Tax=Candidatus Leptofilum sp. TaxID=3241576 RepID=UPI003B5CC981